MPAFGEAIFRRSFGSDNDPDLIEAYMRSAFSPATQEEEISRPIAFYHMLGFVQVGTQPFLLGGDLQTDWVMQNDVAGVI